MNLNHENKLRRFLDYELPQEIEEGLGQCFDKDIDPEVSWKTFREGLAKLKKRHIALAIEYGESDDETEYKSAITKHRESLLTTHTKQ